MTENDRVVLAAENLSYQYGKLNVWEGVDFSVKAGEVIFLVGQNGTGKSTLLRCLAGLGYPSSGKMTLCGEPFSGKNRKQRAKVSFVPDAPLFYDDMTAEEHLQFILKANQKGDEYSHVEQLLESFGLLRYVQQYPSSFSRGMREKLALVIAFSVNPQLYLFDEPYGPLDFDASTVLSAQIKERVSKGASVVLSCHHAVPNLTPDKVWLIDEGALYEKDGSILEELWGGGLYQSDTCENVNIV